MEKHVLFEKKGQVGIITINRPNKLNALNRDVIEGLTAILKEHETDRDIKLMILEGSGEKAFCAGGDVMSVYHMYYEQGYEAAVDVFRMEFELDYFISDYAKPIISYLDGITMGGGVGISIGTDFRIVNEKTRWAMPEMKIGFFPDVGVSYYTSKMEDGFGKYLSLTSESIYADDCVFLGVADYKIDSRDYGELRREIVEFDWRKLNKHELIATVDDIITDYSQEIEKGYLQRHRDDIKGYFDKEDIHEIISSLQADMDYPFAKKALTEVRENAPTSMMVTMEQLNRAKHLYLKECFEQDLTLVRSFLKNKDFFEGVRGKLVEKTNDTKWTPNHLTSVTKSSVERYFEVGNELK